MDRPYIYVFRVEGHLGERWSDWFEGLEIHNHPDGEASLSGRITDQAALLGLLNKLYALNLTLVSVNRLSQEE